MVLLALLYVLSSYLFQIYRMMWAYSNISDMYRLLMASAAGFIAYFACLHAADMPYSTAVLVMTFLITTLLCSFYRIVIRDLYSRRAAAGEVPAMSRRGKKVLVVGAGEAGRIILSEYIKRGLGRLIAGFVDDDPEKVGTILNGKMVFCDTGGASRARARPGRQRGHHRHAVGRIGEDQPDRLADSPRPPVHSDQGAAARLRAGRAEAALHLPAGHRHLRPDRQGGGAGGRRRGGEEVRGQNRAHNRRGRKHRVRALPPAVKVRHQEARGRGARRVFDVQPDQGAERGRRLPLGRDRDRVPDRGHQGPAPPGYGVRPASARHRVPRCGAQARPAHGVQRGGGRAEQRRGHDERARPCASNTGPPSSSSSRPTRP